MAKVQISKEKLKSEIEKCHADPVYFIKNYVRITHPTRGLIPFSTFEYQDNLVRALQTNRFNVVLKARQLGISTLTAAYVLWFMMFRRNKSVLVLATKLGTAGNLVKKVASMYQGLPDHMKIVKVNLSNRQELSFSNESFIKAESTESSSGRSEALSLLVIDEAAHVSNLDGADGLWTSLKPTISRGGSVIAISTPNGASGWFYDTCMSAISGEDALDDENSTQFVLHKLMWWEHPECDEEWFEKETRGFDAKQIAQEYLCSFNASGDTVIDPEILEKLEQKLDSIQVMPDGTTKKYSRPILEMFLDRRLHIWEEMIPGNEYMITVDVARGDSSDYSTIEVFNMTTFNQAAEYKGKVPYDQFTDLIYNVCENYGFPALLVENNMLGHAVLTRLEEMNYPKIIYTKKVTGEWSKMYWKETSSNAGFSTSAKSRPQIVALMEEQIRNDVWNIKSQRLVAELRTFAYINGKPQAQSGRNDDLVMAFCLMCWAKENVFESGEKHKEITEILLTSTSVNRTNFSTNKNLLESPIYVGANPISNKRKSEVERNRYMRYKWLLD